MSEQIDSAVLTGLFTLAGAVVGFLVTLVRDVLNNRSQIRLEKVRLHDLERVEAHKRLFAFARRLANTTFPMAENKRKAFLHLMREEYVGKAQLDYLYFTRSVTTLLDDLESRYTCMTDHDLIPEMNPEEENAFLEHQLFPIQWTPQSRQ